MEDTGFRKSCDCKKPEFSKVKISCKYVSRKLRESNNCCNLIADNDEPIMHIYDFVMHRKVL